VVLSNVLAGDFEDYFMEPRLDGEQDLWRNLPLQHGS